MQIVKRILIGGWRRFRKYIFLKLLVAINVIAFLLRELFFGSENSNNFLRSISQPAIIPILKIKGAQIGKKSVVQSGVCFHNCKNFRNLIIGENCHIGKNCFFDLRESVIIGNNVVIAMNNTFISHLDMNNSKLKNIYPAKQKSVEIQDDVYIGTNCTILMGVSIGTSSIVGANSLVNSNIEKNAIWGGVPALKIKELSGV